MGKLAAPVRADKEMMFTNRQLVALMWPLLLEQLLAITVGLADSLMVATVGDAAISAVSLVDSISNLMIYIFSAMATGGAAVAGQYIGQRQKEDACNAGQQLIALLGAVSIFFVALLYLFRMQILTVMFGHIEPDVMAATNTYYLYVMASIPGSLLMNSINVIGNAVLIFGFGMDVAGVAIPTLVSRTVAAVVILSLLFNRDLMLHLSDIRGFRVDMRLMKNIFYIGVPSGVENGMFQLGRLVLFSLISTFGTASMVANAIGNTISNFNCFAGQAINLGLAAVVSQCVGAGEFDQARAYLRKIVKWTYGIMAAVNLTIIALLPLIMRVYNVSPEAEKLAVTVTLIHGISSIFIWVPAFMVPGFLRAAGDARFTMLASMLTMWVVRVLLAYVLGKYMGYGVIGVWFAHAIVDWSVRGAIFFLRYRSGKWETMGIKT